MARTKISEFSATPGDNTDIDGIDIAEGCAPSGINNAIRELMAQLKDMQTGASGDTFTLTTVNSTTVDTTNLEATNLKAKDGTAAGSIANTTGVVTLASSVLTTADINGGTVDGTTIGASSASTGAFTTLASNGATTFTAGTASTSTTTGTAVITGGLGVSGRINAANFDGIVGANTAAAVSSTNLAYTGTLTGGTGVVNLGSGQVYKDASGNVGIGVTPNAWGAGYKVIQIGSAGSIWSPTAASSQMLFNANSYFDGSVYRYINTNSASDYFQNAGSHTWRTAPSGTAGNVISFSQAMTLDSSGNLGIGTSSPSQKLHVVGSILTTPSTWGSSGTGAVYLGDTNNYVSSTFGGSTTFAGFGGLTFGTTSSGYSEKMRLDFSGNLLVGTTSTNPIADRVNGIATGPVGFLTSRASNNMALGLSGTSGINITFYTDNGSTYVTAGSITSNGSVTAFNTSSDYRMKENVQPMFGALNKVLSLKPVTYKWKPEFAGTNPNGQGFIAHELQAVVPDCVTGEKDAVDKDGKPKHQSVDSSFLVATLVSAIQEQQTLITQLQADVATLKGAA
jgi:hypothetical protein